MADYEISASDAAKLLEENKIVVLDVREPWEYSLGHIEGSISMPMGDVPARASQELHPNEHLVVVCHMGVRSMHVTLWLRNQGFDKAQSLQGGIDAWSSQVDAAIPRY